MVTCLGLTWARVALPVVFVTLASRLMTYEVWPAWLRQGAAPETVACTVKGTASRVPLEMALAGRSRISMLRLCEACADAAGRARTAARAAARRSGREGMAGTGAAQSAPLHKRWRAGRRPPGEVGRASGRERGEISVV